MKSLAFHSHVVKIWSRFLQIVVYTSKSTDRNSSFREKYLRKGIYQSYVLNLLGEMAKIRLNEILRLSQSFGQNLVKILTRICVL